MTASRLLVLVLLAFACPSVLAATFFVNTTAIDLPDADVDDGVCDANIGMSGNQCTLRAAIMQANATPGMDTIVLPIGATITLTIPADPGSGGDSSAAVGDLNIRDSVLIAPAAAVPVNPNDWPEIVAQNGSRIFAVSFGPSSLVEFRGLSLREGGNPNQPGGAMLVSGGTVTIDRVRFEDNTAAFGGAIANNSSLLVIDSDFSRNRAGSGVGAAIHTGSSDSTILRNSSIRQIRADTDQVSALYQSSASSLLIENTLIDGTNLLIGSNETGGIRAANPAELTLRNVTMTRFSQSALSLNAGAVDNVRIYNSVLDANGSTCDFDFSEESVGTSIIDNSYVSDTSCDALLGDDVNVGGPLLLSSLESVNGSVVQSRTPAFGSVLLDAGLPADAIPEHPAQVCLTTDQRGTMRPLDGDADGEPRCDIGAIEASTLTDELFSDRFESP